MTQVPKDLKYTEEHEWVHLSDDGKEAIIGITDHAQKELGDIVYIEMPQDGTSFAQMEVFGSIEAVKTVADLYAPLAGEVIEVNHLLQDEPTLVNSSPYEDGWMIKLRVANPKELDALLSADDYKERIHES